MLHSLHCAVRGRAAAFEMRVFAMLPAADGMFHNVGEVVCAMLVAVDWEEVDCAALVDAVANAMPQRRMPEADRLFLDVVYVLLERSVEIASRVGCEVVALANTLMKCGQFVDVVKSSVLSEEIGTLERVTKIVATLCHECLEIAELFCACGVFEYIVESIRSVGQGDGSLSVEKKNKLFLSVESVAAIVIQKPKGLTEKWCYCLDVIVSVCEHLSEGPQAQMITDILGHAFKHAAPPIFTDELIDKFVAFEMMLCTRMLQRVMRNSNGKKMECGGDTAFHYESVVTHGIESLTMLFTRYRPSLETIHSVLRICEGASQPKSPWPCMFAFMVQLVNHFISIYKARASEEAIGIPALQILGQRLLFIMFDLWARALEGSVEDTQTTLHVFKSVDGFLSAMDMFSVALSPVFISSGSCSNDDQKGMRSWCWKYFPPKIIWYIYAEFDRLTGMEKADVKQIEMRLSVRRYLWSISGSGEPPHSDRLTTVETTEDTYLEGLARGPKNSDSCAITLFEMGMEFDALDGLCSPDLLAEALCTRLGLLFSTQNQEASFQALKTVRGISFICCRFGLQFRMLEMPPNTLEMAFRAEQFSISNSRDFDIFQQTVLRGRTSLADVLAWNSFAEYIQNFETASLPQESEVWTMLCEHTQTVTSVTYALSKSTLPENISSCLLGMFEGHEIPCRLVSSFEKAGVADLLCGLVKSLPRQIFPTSQSKTAEVGEDYFAEHRRVSCFIAVLSGGGFLAGSRTNWNLLSLVCEAFGRETVSLEGPSDVLSLLFSLIRCLIAILVSTRDGKVRSYMHQNGVTAQLVRVLRFWSGSSLSQDMVTSAAACLLVLVVGPTDSAEVIPALNPILSELLQDLSTWERVLCSFPMSSGGDRCCKVTNCCFLLDSLLKRTSLSKEKRLAVSSRRVILPLTRAASSSDALLEEAALRVLKTMIEMNPSQFEGSSSLCLLRRLATHNVTKLCSSTARKLSDFEIAYARVAVLCGHADNELHELEKTVRRWSDRKQDKSDPEHETALEHMFPHMSALLSALGDRARALAKATPSASPGWADHIIADVGDVKQGRSSESYPTQCPSPQVLFGRYSAALRARGCNIHLPGSS